MAGIDFSRPLLGAGASAKTDFAAAQARAGLNFIGEARFKRGVKAELGIGVFADASAELSKFIRATIAGTAFARAQAGVQLQLPLNLFDEFGFSARAEAIAEAAAGVKATLGLSLGDFVLLMVRDPELVGLPLEILLLFLEEVSIGGTFEINVAAAAKAHASVSVSGSIIEKAGEKAGFFYTVDAGAGLTAGVGMGLKAGAEFKNFRRFYGRAVDRTIDTTIREIIRLLPAELKTSANLDSWLEAFAPVAKIALRSAYDVGLKIAENNPGRSSDDTAILCNETIKTFLEEAQRFILGKLLESGLDGIRKLLEQQIPSLPAGKWDGAKKEREALATHLLAMPAEPFQDSAENLSYWQELLRRSADLVIAIGDPDPELHKVITLLYCSSELLMEAVRSKLNTASAYATVIGLGTVNADTQPFKGSVNNQPPTRIATTIKQTIGRNPSVLTYADLLQFLVDDVIVNNLISAFPELGRFVNIFKDDFSKQENEIIKLFLQHSNAFDLSNPAAATADPRALLNLMVRSLNRFVDEKLKSEVLPLVLENISDRNLKLYIEEVLFAAVVYMKDVGLNAVVNWDRESFDNDDFTEALAGVMMLLLGRTVVLVGDTFITAAQEQFLHSCNDAADKIVAGDPEVRDLVPFTDPDLVRLTADCVRIGGRVLGPLENDTRKRLRQLLYQVFEPIPPGREATFLERLGDDFFIPNLSELEQLTEELTNISKDRFVQFVEQFILRVGEYVLEEIEQLIADLIELIVNWEQNLSEALLAVAGLLRNLEENIRLMNMQLTGLLNAATDAFRSFLQTLGSSTLRTSIKTSLKNDFMGGAFVALEENPVYQALPSNWRRDIRGLVNSAVDAAIDNPFTQPVFNAISGLSGALEDLLPDFRELDPDDNLPAQVMDLVLDKVEQQIKNHFGSLKPAISPIIKFTYSEWVIDSLLPPRGHWETKHILIPLGRIEINLHTFITSVRRTIERSNYYHNLLNDACFKLAKVFAKELELAAQELLRDKTKTDKLRLEKLDSEHNNLPKQIAVLSPLSMAHITGNIPLKIHLGGVPLSYLGLGKDEMQRVLVYVNGELIPPDSFTVSALPPGSGENAGIGAGMGARESSGKGIGGREGAGLGKGSGTDGYGFSLERDTRIADTGKTHIGKVAVNSYRVNRISGNKLTAGQSGGLLPAAMPALVIESGIDPDAKFIVEGVNVLTVVVIERGGNRHQQHLSFTVSRQPVSAAAPAGTIGVLHPGTGRVGGVTMTLTGILNHFKDSQSAEKITMESYLQAILKTKPDKAEPQPPGSNGLKKPPITTIKRTETLQVIEKKGGKDMPADEPIRITYASAAERREMLQSRGLDNPAMAKKNQRLETTSISYVKAEPDKKVAGSAKNNAAAGPLPSVSRAAVTQRMAASVATLKEQHRSNLIEYTKKTDYA